MNAPEWCQNYAAAFFKEFVALIKEIQSPKGDVEAGEKGAARGMHSWRVCPAGYQAFQCNFQGAGKNLP